MTFVRIPKLLRNKSFNANQRFVLTFHYMMLADFSQSSCQSEFITIMHRALRAFFRKKKTFLAINLGTIFMETGSWEEKSASRMLKQFQVGTFY